MKTSKLTAVELKKQLEYGKVYKVALESGDMGEETIPNKENYVPKVGDEWMYNVEESQYGPKIKRAGGKSGGKVGSGFSKEPFEERAVSYAYSYCKDWLHGRPEATKEQWVGLANYICDAMIATYKRVKP